MRDEFDFLSYALSEVNEWQEQEFKHTDLRKELGYAKTQLGHPGGITSEMAGRVIGGLLWHVTTGQGKQASRDEQRALNDSLDRFIFQLTHILIEEDVEEASRGNVVRKMVDVLEDFMTRGRYDFSPKEPTE